MALQEELPLDARDISHQVCVPRRCLDCNDGLTDLAFSDPFVASNWAVASFVLISAASWYASHFMYERLLIAIRRRCRSIQATQKEQIQIIRDQLEKKARRKAQGGDSTVIPSAGNPA